MPFDAFCPSLVKKETLARRCCGTCGKYFQSVAAQNRHQAAHVSVPHDDTESQDIDDDKESADLGLHEDASEEEDAPVFRNIFEIMRWPLILYECIFVSIFIVINCLVVSMQNMPL